MNRNLSLLALLVLVATSFRPPGSATAHLSGKSESGKTRFAAEIQDIDGLLAKAELTVENNKLLFTDEDNVFVIFDPGKKVLTLYFEGKANSQFPNGRFLRVWALPESFKTITHNSENQEYEFRARIEGTEPRKGKGLQIPQVELICRLSYEI